MQLRHYSDMRKKEKCLCLKAAPSSPLLLWSLHSTWWSVCRARLRGSCWGKRWRSARWAGPVCVCVCVCVCVLCMCKFARVDYSVTRSRARMSAREEIDRRDACTRARAHAHTHTHTHTERKSIDEINFLKCVCVCVCVCV